MRAHIKFAIHNKTLSCHALQLVLRAHALSLQHELGAPYCDIQKWKEFPALAGGLIRLSSSYLDIGKTYENAAA